MKVINTKIPDVKIIEPTVYADERGYFFESFNKKDFCDAIGREINFVQDNHSHSLKGVLRGLHYQIKQAQGKLVRVTCGKVYDVAVDIRESSPTFGKWVGQELSTENHRQLWIPEGFAHGFLVLSDSADFMYKTTDYYSPVFERCISWEDQTISIKWPFDDAPILSDKDKNGVLIENADLFP
jgi:dTDP-4-dehydrorhamnose 3,5-epimerase